MDWHQTGGKVTVSIFAKCADALKTRVKANQVSLDFSVVFGDDVVYADSFELCGVNIEHRVIFVTQLLRNLTKIRLSTFLLSQQVINVDKSAVKIYGTKVEIILQKADGMNWAQLKYKAPS